MPTSAAVASSLARTLSPRGLAQAIPYLTLDLNQCLHDKANLFGYLAWTSSNQWTSKTPISFPDIDCTYLLGRTSSRELQDPLFAPLACDRKTRTTPVVGLSDNAFHQRYSIASLGIGREGASSAAMLDAAMSPPSEGEVKMGIDRADSRPALTPPTSEKTDKKDDESGSELSDLEPEEPLEDHHTQPNVKELEEIVPDHYYEDGKVPVFKPVSILLGP